MYLFTKLEAREEGEDHFSSVPTVIKRIFLIKRTLLSQFPNLTNHSLFAIINAIATMQQQ